MYGLTRDKEYISSLIYKKGSEIKCKEKCVIEFPSWYFDREMGELGEHIHFYGIFAIIVGDKYAVSAIPTMMTANPITITNIDRDGVNYTRLTFGKDDPLFDGDKVFNMTLLAYNFFDNFFMRIKKAWFMDPVALHKAMTNTVKYAGSAIGVNPITNELIVSEVTRSSKDLDVRYRLVNNKGPFEFVSLTDRFHSVDNTISKLTGSYLQEGIISALVKDPVNEEATDIEKHLKG